MFLAHRHHPRVQRLHVEGVRGHRAAKQGAQVRGERTGLGVVRREKGTVDLQGPDLIVPLVLAGVRVEEAGVRVPFSDRTVFTTLFPVRRPFTQGDRQAIPACLPQSILSCR